MYLRPAIEANLLDRIRADLFVRLALIDATPPRARTDLERGGWDALADELAPRAHGRVTFIDATGIVIGDSEVARGDLDHVENHRDRPEVAAALAGTPQTAMRYSATIQKRLMYVGRSRCRCPAARRGVARLAVPIDEVDAPGRRRPPHPVGRAAGRAGRSRWSRRRPSAQVMSRSLRRMTDVARRMSAGDLDGAPAACAATTRSPSWAGAGPDGRPTWPPR